MVIGDVLITLVLHAQQGQFNALVDQILSAKRAEPDADVSILEAEIDQLVYSFYGLTHEEIAIIEESVQERTANRRVTDDSELEQLP